jgi:hypothetical protein
MAQRRQLTVAATPSPTAEVVAGSRPKPPKAEARSASLDTAAASADHPRSTRRLTRNTVAQARRAEGTPAA